MVSFEECGELGYGLNALDYIRVFFEADSDHMGIVPFSRRQKMERLELT
jgi:hypothetical protein